MRVSLLGMGVGDFSDIFSLELNKVICSNSIPYKPLDVFLCTFGVR